MSKLAQVLKKHIVMTSRAEGLAGAILPQIAQRANKVAANPRSTIEEMEGLIKSDPVVTTKVVQVASSPLYPQIKKVESVKEAIIKMGFEGVRNVVFLVSMHAQVVKGTNRENAQRLWHHAVAVASGAQFMAGVVRLKSDTAFLCGLLHDIGRVVAGSALIGLKRKEPYIAQLKERQIDEVIDQIHAEIGGFLSRRWGFDDAIVECIEKHHEPPSGRNLPTLVGLVDTVCTQEGWGSRPSREVPAVGPHVAALNITADHLDALRGYVNVEVKRLGSI